MSNTKKIKPEAEEKVTPTVGMEFKSKGKKSGERVTLFSVDGKDFTVPKEVPPSVYVKARSVARKFGDIDAFLEVAETLFGPGQFDAYIDLELEDEEYEHIAELLMLHVQGKALNSENEGKSESE